jgi:D-sedoheptulose 7-phosphate isomerase
MDSVSRYLLEAVRVVSDMPRQAIAELVSLIYQAYRRRSQIFVLGNGGSAATASHLANDLSKATIVPGKPRLRVIALTDNISLITAWANDTSYELVFKEQLENLLESGDVVIGLTASGNSPNVLRAMEFARRHGAVTIGWTGMTGGRLKDTVEYCVHSPTDDVGMIESTHLLLDHLVTNELQQLIQKEPASEPLIEEEPHAQAAFDVQRRRIVKVASRHPARPPHELVGPE